MLDCEQNHPKIIPDERPGVSRVPDKVPGNPCGITTGHVTKVCIVHMPCDKLRAFFDYCCKCKNSNNQACIDAQIAAQHR